ncbi:plastocyanin/azurin family copper-binding protein [Castellaniella caeni]|uniref:plastocyanin/azurin family copper-binding protein n=1 Tax=Castellaniella caeni TaxID=266123 RepID=UPI000834A8B2|nr:plastocyanin/azurin family copper-binding protein [Castellaniella caeni]
MSTAAFNPQRRRLLAMGGGLLLTAAVIRRAGAAEAVEIQMSGTPSGSQVWFRPHGLLIQPGQTVRWVNSDTGNAHTTTAYHPKNHKPLRIPDGATPWDSGYLLPGQSFEVVLSVPGVYDYFCLPHEMAGMVGRIVVGTADAAHKPYAATDAQLPAVALAQFPDVAAILKSKRID